MKKPIIMKSDVIVVGVATVISVIGAFTAYRYGRKVEIKEIVDVVSDQGMTTFKFNTGGKITKIGMELIE